MCKVERQEADAHLVGITNRGALQQVLVRTLLRKRHVALVLLEAALPVQPELGARASDLAVVADEELVHEDLLRGAPRLLGEDLAVGAAHVARVHGKLDLVFPPDAATRCHERRVQLGPRRRAKLVRARREEPGKVEPREIEHGAVDGRRKDRRRESAVARGGAKPAGTWPALARASPRVAVTRLSGNPRLVIPRHNYIHVG